MAAMDDEFDQGLRESAQVNIIQSGFNFPFPNSAENLRFLGALIYCAFDPDKVPKHREDFQTGVDITKAYYKFRFPPGEILMKRVKYRARPEVGMLDPRLVALRVLGRDILGSNIALHRSDHGPPCPTAVNIHCLWNGKKVNLNFPPERKRISDILAQAGIVAGTNEISAVTFNGVPAADGIPVQARYYVDCVDCQMWR